MRFERAARIQPSRKSGNAGPVLGLRGHDTLRTQMAERESPKHPEPQSQADRTLLGVAPPRLESSPDSALRSPVFVRSGTSVADVEPPPLPRMALPSRPPRSFAGAMETPGMAGDVDAGKVGALPRALRVARLHPALWMVLAPALIAVTAIGVVLAVTPPPAPKSAQVAVTSGGAARPSAGAAAEIAAEKPLPTLAELEARPPESLAAHELLRLAEGRSQRRLSEAKALCNKIEQSPDLLNDKATQADLLRLARDGETAHQALAVLATVKSPLGADLLYELWTGKSPHTDSTELSRALALSTDVRPRASAALSVALDLRAADSCEKLKAILPNALKAGDRRSLAPLAKLTSKRGCGPKKTEDCYACLRSEPDELVATINAVKSRRAPVYPSP
jgi:hypothetical protein